MLTKTIGLCAVLCLCIGGVCGVPAARAQASGAQVTPPPKVLVISVENLKMTTSPSAHRKTESAFVNLSGQAKLANYVALDALSGPPRALFFWGYDSYAAAEKELQAEMNGPAASQMDSALQADGELLESQSRSIYMLRDDLSHNPAVPIATMRYMQISRIHVRIGHQQEWEEYLKMLRSNLDKAEPDRHIAVYQSDYGWQNGGVWLLITPMKSLDEIDKAEANSAKFREAMGEDNMKHYRELAASAIDSAQRNLFAFNPSMSFVSDAWVNADPSFWKRK